MDESSMNWMFDLRLGIVVYVKDEVIKSDENRYFRMVLSYEKDPPEECYTYRYLSEKIQEEKKAIENGMIYFVLRPIDNNYDKLKQKSQLKPHNLKRQLKLTGFFEARPLE